MTAEKRVNFAFFMSFGVILFQIIDIFLLHSSVELTPVNLASSFISLVIILILSRFIRFNLKRLCFKLYGWYFEILYGFVFSVTPVVLVYLFKYVYFHYRGYENLELTFNPPGFLNAPFGDSLFYSALVYVLSLLIVVLFKELFYRGYLITQFTDKLGVNKSVFIQAFIYTMSFAPVIVLYLVNGRFDFQGPLMTVFLICGHLFLDLICGLKWGVFYKINGTLWMSVTDHLVNKFLVTSFYFTEHRLPEKWFIIEAITIQLLSIIMFIPFYYHRDKMNKLTAEEIALSEEAKRMRVVDFSPRIVRRRVVGNTKHGVTTEEVFEFEEPVSLSDVNMPGEEDVILSIGGYSIDDTHLNYTTEVDSHDSDPTEKSRQYFDDMIGREDSGTTDYSNDKSNADNISGLVQDYFKKNFDKHTFS
jgi:hypothetical protein